MFSMYWNSSHRFRGLASRLRPESMDQTSSPFNKTNILNIPVRPNRPAPPKKKQVKLMIILLVKLLKDCWTKPTTAKCPVSYNCWKKKVKMGLLMVVLGDCHLCVDWTSIRHPSIDHQLFHPSSVNGHLFLIRLAGGVLEPFPAATGWKARINPGPAAGPSHTHSLTSRCILDSPVKPVFMFLVCGRKLGRLEKSPLLPALCFGALVVPLN